VRFTVFTIDVCVLHKHFKHVCLLLSYLSSSEYRLLKNQHSLMKMRIYTTSVISRGGEGGGEFVRIIRKKVRIICTRKSRAKYTQKLFCYCL